MWRSLGISESDWENASPAVRLAFAALEHRLRLAEIRCTGYEQQLAGVRAQLSRLDELEAEVAELRERLGQNSNNSSRPPSSDPPSAPSTPPARPTGRRRGGQPGHRGSSRRMVASEAVDHVIDLKPTHCGQCGRRLRGADPEPQRHQVSEVPAVRAEVTEYRRHRLRCRGCGTATRAPWPAGVTASSFGPRVRAVTAYWTGRLSLSHRDVVEALRVLYGLELSLGSVTALQRQVSAALATPVEQARRFVQRQRAQYVDETSWRERRRAAWLWVNATSQVTAFEILEGRASEQAKRVIDATAKGVVTSDRYAAYNWLAAQRRQLCWAHLRRDFQAMVERGGDSATIGEALRAQTTRLFRLWHRARDGDLSREQLAAALEPVRRGVRQALEAGVHCGQKKTRRACTNILKRAHSLWRFVRVEGVEPTNNAAERALRRAVLWRRTSFGTESPLGSRFVERILTAVTTLRQQGREVLVYLTQVCAGADHDGESTPSLLPEPFLPSLLPEPFLVPTKG